MLYAILIAFTIIVCLFFIRFIIPKAKDTRYLWLLVLAILSAVIWQSAEFITSYTFLGDFAKILLWKIGDLGALLLFVLVFHFLSAYIKLKINKLLIWGEILLLLVIAGIIILSDNYILGLTPHIYINWTDIQGPLKYLQNIPLVLYTIGIITLLFVRFLKAEDVNKKKKFALMFTGMGFSAILGIVSDIILPKAGIEIVPLGGISFVLFLSTIVIAIYRFQFLDFRMKRFTISQKILYSFLFLIIIYSFLISYSINQFGVNQIAESLVGATNEISEQAVVEAAESAEKLVGQSYSRLGVEIAQKIGLFWHKVGVDVLYLADIYAIDKENFIMEGSRFQTNHSAEIWYNAGTDKEPISVQEYRPLYPEITFIDKNGQERIKLKDGEQVFDLADVSIPENTLFKNEEYFQKAVNLPKGEFYASPLMAWYLSEPDIKERIEWPEDKALVWEEVPGRDTMKEGIFRFAAPVYAGDELLGVMVLNLDYWHFADLTKHIDPADENRVISATYSGNYILVFDEDGNTITHPKPNNVRGFLPDGTLMHSNTAAKPGGIFNLRDYDQNDSYRQIYDSTINREEIIMQTARDVGGRTKMTISIPVIHRHGGVEFFKGGLMMSVNNDNFLAATEDFKKNIGKTREQTNLNVSLMIEKVFIQFLAWTLLAVTSLIALVLLILHRAVFKPIKKLQIASVGIGRGDFSGRIDIDSRDEIGDLAKTFQAMMGDLENSQLAAKEYEQNLEKKVAEKTKELKGLLEDIQDDKEQLVKQRSATLNILEDVSETQNRVAEANKALEKKKMELESMKSLSDELSGALDVNEVILIFSKYIKNLLDFSTLTFLLVDYSEDQGVIYSSFLNKPVNEKYLLRNGEILLESFKDKKDEVSKTMRAVVKMIKPHMFGEKLDNDSTTIIKAHNVIPLQIADRYLGLILLTSETKELFGKDSTGLIDAMIVTLSLSIDRLNTLLLTQHSKTVSLVESLSDGVLMLNHKKNVQLMNEAFSRFTGLSKDYFGIDNLYKLFPDIEMTDMLEQALGKGKISHINEIKLLNKFFEIFVTPVRDNHDNIVAVAMIFHDITTLKEIDQLKTEFVSVASHQLRTPLTAIKLFTDMLRREEVGKLNEGQKTYIENVHESTERMVRLVNDLLNVTRIESGRLRIEPQPVDVCDLVKSIAGELKPLAENEGKTIELKFESELKDIPLDQNLIRQVVHNLLANAIRYSAKNKGKVVCTVEKSSKNFFQISVKDNGIGIPEKVQPRIFEKFYRADNAVKSITEGTGLGLYVSRMIVEVSGGKVWFESIENQGSTFFVQLPMAGMPKKEGERGLVIS